MAEIASTEWFMMVAGLLKADPEFAEKAKGFTADMVFGADGGEQTLFCVHDGAIVDCRAAGDGDVDAAEYVILASPESWDDLRSGKLDLLFGLLTSKVRLVKGDQAKLVQYYPAAQVIFQRMKDVPADAITGEQPG